MNIQIEKDAKSLGIVSGTLAAKTIRKAIEENGFALPFEVISMLLLAAMIGCIVIALRSKPETV